MPSAEPKWLVISQEIRICNPAAMPLLPLLHELDSMWTAIAAFYLTEISIYTGTHQTKQTTVTFPEARAMQKSQSGRPPKLIQL